jgi:anti-sigma factor RsiW
MRHHVIDLLPGYLDRDNPALNPAEREQIARHLQTCRTCADAFEQTTRLNRELHNTFPLIGRPSGEQLRRMRQRVLAESFPAGQARAQAIRRWSSIGVTLAATMSALLLAALFFSSPTYVNAAPPQSADRYMHTQTGQIDVKHTDTPVAGDNHAVVLNVTPPAPTGIRLTGNPAPSPDPSIFAGNQSQAGLR